MNVDFTDNLRVPNKLCIYFIWYINWVLQPVCQNTLHDRIHHSYKAFMYYTPRLEHVYSRRNDLLFFFTYRDNYKYYTSVVQKKLSSLNQMTFMYASHLLFFIFIIYLSFNFNKNNVDGWFIVKSIYIFFMLYNSIINI